MEDWFSLVTAAVELLAVLSDIAVGDVSSDVSGGFVLAVAVAEEGESIVGAGGEASYRKLVSLQ